MFEDLFKVVKKRFNDSDDEYKPMFKCPRCQGTSPLTRYEELHRVCPLCNYHGRLSAQERIAITVDKESFCELDGGMTSGNPIDFPDYEELFDADLDELVRMGYNKDEVEFCYAVLVYDAELIKKHIALKTNPKVYVSGELAPGTGFRNDGTSYSALFSCFDFHYDAVVHYGVIDYWTGNEINKEQSVRGDDVLNLLQAAAYLRLGKQLKTL